MSRLWSQKSTYSLQSALMQWERKFKECRKGSDLSLTCVFAGMAIPRMDRLYPKCFVKSKIFVVDSSIISIWSWAWVSAMSLSWSELFLDIWQFKEKSRPSLWVQSASRLYNSYNICLCTRPDRAWLSQEVTASRRNHWPSGIPSKIRLYSRSSALALFIKILIELQALRATLLGVRVDPNWQCCDIAVRLPI